MSDVSLPILLLTDRTLFQELKPLFTKTAQQLAARNIPNAILMFEVGDAPEWSHTTVKPAENPDRMLVMALQSSATEAVARALAKVNRDQPELSERKRQTLKIKDGTPLRNFFRQLEEVPLTVFRLADAKAPGEALFFLRTPTVVAEFKRELPAALLASSAAVGNGPANGA